MVKDRLRRMLVPALALALLSGAAACGDNPVEVEHEEHPEGLALLDAQGETVVTITAGPTVEGRIEVAAGETVTFTVVALAEDGDDLPIDGDELSVRVGASPAVAAVTLQGSDRLRVAGGDEEGTGTVRLDLMHGGHAEWGGEVPVLVTP